MTEILYGKSVAEAISGELKQRIARLAENNVIPSVAVLRVGDSESDISYEKGIEKRAQSLGIDVVKFHFDKNVSASDLIDRIKRLNADATVHGIILFRPLSTVLRASEREIVDSISPEKDVDGASKLSLAGVFLNEDVGFPPCTPQACITLLDHYGIKTEGKRIAVIGRSSVVGKPLALMLTERNATVTLCHTKTENLPEITRSADILITAAGKVGLIGKEHLNPGQIVVDVSVNFDADTGRMCGDVNASEFDHVAAITPVPGGVGAVTNTILMQHIVSATEKSINT